jgi:hypothetical protein
VTVAACNCRCDDYEKCGREASNYCDGCLDSLCGACYGVVQLGEREHVMDYCEGCAARLRAWANREGVRFEVLEGAAHTHMSTVPRQVAV